MLIKLGQYEISFFKDSYLILFFMSQKKMEKVSLEFLYCFVDILVGINGTLIWKVFMDFLSFIYV